jgi:hypothetical protein
MLDKPILVDIGLIEPGKAFENMECVALPKPSFGCLLSTYNIEVI